MHVQRGTAKTGGSPMAKAPANRGGLTLKRRYLQAEGV